MVRSCHLLQINYLSLELPKVPAILSQVGVTLAEAFFVSVSNDTKMYLYILVLVVAQLVNPHTGMTSIWQ